MCLQRGWGLHPLVVQYACEHLPSCSAHFPQLAIAIKRRGRAQKVVQLGFSLLSTMSGLEPLIVVPIVGGVYAWWKGRKEKNRDEQELAADTAEVRLLREAMQKAHHGMSEQHKVSADVWRGPLSLFGKRDEKRAQEAHVPQWAIDCVHRMQTLVHEAASQGDRADVYKTQLDVAEKDGKGLMRGPVVGHVQKLEQLTFDLRLENERLAQARAAFDSPDTAPREQPEASITKSKGGKLNFGYTPGRLDLEYEVVAAYPTSLQELPARFMSLGEDQMKILRDRGKWGKAYVATEQAAEVANKKGQEATWKTIMTMGQTNWSAISAMNSMNGNASVDFFAQKKLQEEARRAREREGD